MKKTIQLLTVFVSCILLMQFASAQKMDYETKLWFLANSSKTYFQNIKNTEEFSKPQTNEPVTLEMLNAPKGIYRTYDDFLKKNVEAMLYTENNPCGHAGTKFFVVDLEFKDASKKLVKIKPETIWGFVDNIGRLYRIGKFFSPPRWRP